MSVRSIFLKDLDVKMQGPSTLTVQQMIDNPRFTILLMSLPTTSIVYSAGAVIGSTNRSSLMWETLFSTVLVLMGDYSLSMCLPVIVYNIILLRVMLGFWLPAFINLERVAVHHFVLYKYSNPWTHLVFKCITIMITHCFSSVISFAVFHQIVSLKQFQ